MCAIRLLLRSYVYIISAKRGREKYTKWLEIKILHCQWFSKHVTLRFKLNVWQVLLFVIFFFLSSSLSLFLFYFESVWFKFLWSTLELTLLNSHTTIYNNVQTSDYSFYERNLPYQNYQNIIVFRSSVCNECYQICSVLVNKYDRNKSSNSRLKPENKCMYQAILFFGKFCQSKANW